MTVFALSTGHQIGLGLVGLAVVLFALVSSMVLPRRSPDFPGRHLRGFLMVSLLFFVAMLFAVFYFGRESHEGGSRAAAQTQTQTAATETTATETAPATTSTTGGSADLAAGRKLFTANCAGCHTLRDAKTSGTVGPNLDALKPDQATVERQVENGGGAMPAFSGTLSSEQISTVSAYVAAVAGT